PCGWRRLAVPLRHPGPLRQVLGAGDPALRGNDLRQKNHPCAKQPPLAQGAPSTAAGRPHCTPGGTEPARRLKWPQPVEAPRLTSRSCQEQGTRSYKNLRSLPDFGGFVAFPPFGPQPFPACRTFVLLGFGGIFPIAHTLSPPMNTS